MTLSPVEIGVFEKLFKMRGGYVLDFTNKTFDQFIFESIDIDVRDGKYIEKVEEKMYSASKANILRYIWNNEPENIIIKLLSDLTDYYESLYDEVDEKLLNKAEQILSKYNNDKFIDNNHPEIQIVNLINDINDSIKKGMPQFTLDRLHTLMCYYVEELCDKHGIQYTKKEDKLNQMFKRYAEFIDDKLESELSKTIIMQTGSIFDKYNTIRNNKSYAHANDILNEAESLLIYSDIVNVFKFIQTIEQMY